MKKSVFALTLLATLLLCGCEGALEIKTPPEELMMEQTKESQSSYTFAPIAHTYTTAGFYCDPAIRLGWTF